MPSLTDQLFIGFRDNDVVVCSKFKDMCKKEFGEYSVVLRVCIDKILNDAEFRKDIFDMSRTKISSNSAKGKK